VLAKYRGSSASIEDYVASHRSLDGWGRPKDPSDAYMSDVNTLLSFASSLAPFLKTASHRSLGSV